MAQRKSRRWIILLIVVGVAGALAYAFWPKPLSVELGVVERGPMMVTIDEDAKTRVHEVYVVSTPVAGRLQRVDVEPGETVSGGESVVARMLPTNPAALDVRTKEQAQAAVKASEAALQAARADLTKAVADKDLAELDLQRTKQLFEKDIVAQAALDRAERVALLSAASLDTATAAIAMREADVSNARALLIGFGDQPEEAEDGVISLRAPVSGRVLRILQESATTLPAGAPVLEIGDTSNGLEIVVELLSSDAVQVHVGDRVIVSNWGGQNDLGGVVTRVDPWGFTKFSALGVEEQRVNAIVEFTEPWEQRQNLGHGFRVEVKLSFGKIKMPCSFPPARSFVTAKNGRCSWWTLALQQNESCRSDKTTGCKRRSFLV